MGARDPDTEPPGPTPNGWRVLRERRERNFRVDFAPLRRAIRRNEFVSSVVELFVGAVVGVTKINLGVADDGKGDERPTPPSEGLPPESAP